MISWKRTVTRATMIFMACLTLIFAPMSPNIATARTRPPMHTTSLVIVGDSFDACAQNNTVRIYGRDGNVYVSANSSQLIPLPAITNETYWFCGGTRERVANGLPYNWLLIQRASNGAIQWVFYLNI